MIYRDDPTFIKFFKALEPYAHSQEQCEQMALAAMIAERELDWSDKPDDLTDAIREAHPSRTKDYDTYVRAIELVGNRYRKYALVDLVNYLLVRAAKATHD